MQSVLHFRELQYDVNQSLMTGMSAVQFCDLPDETKGLIVDVVKKKLYNLGCEVPFRKLRKYDVQFDVKTSSLTTDDRHKSNSMNTLPAWVRILCEVVETKRETVGLFRRNITDAKMQDLKSEIIQNSSIGTVSGTEGAALLKNMLRSMNPNLFSNHFTKLLIHLWEIYDEKSILLEALLLLPLPYLLLCRRIFHCFHFISCNSDVNMMTQQNLATCVSMSLFDLENPQVNTANILNEIVSFLISVCYQIGTITEEVYSSAIKAVEQDSIKRKRFPEKMRIKTNSSKKLTTSASKCEMSKSRQSSSQSGEPLRRITSKNESSISDNVSKNLPKRSRHLFATKEAKLSPSFTTSDLPELDQNEIKDPMFSSVILSSFDRSASFTNSGKGDLPRSVSGVRKRRFLIDDSSASAFNSDLDESYNASKLNFVTFDSTPEVGGADSDCEHENVLQTKQNGDSEANTPLLVGAASAVKATRLRGEFMSEWPNSVDKENGCSRFRRANSEKHKSTSCDTNTSLGRLTQTPETKTNEFPVIVGATKKVTPPNCTPLSEPLKTVNRELEKLKQLSGKKESPLALKAVMLTQSSTPKHLVQQRRTPVHKSNLCSITEDRVQGNFDFSPIGIDHAKQAAAKTCSSSFDRNEDKVGNDSEITDNEVFHSAFDFDTSASLPFDEDDRRISFCLQSDSHKNNFKNLKQLWESSKTSDD